MSGAASNHRHIPPELVEEILHKLPLKSVIRFSSVSKTWNSMIRGSNFVKTYRGRKLMVLKFGDDLRDAFKTPLSSRDLQLRHATPLGCPFKDSSLHLHATCDELWCVEVEGSLFLWNPSTQTFRKLPDPSLPPRYRNEFSYGLGYDSVDGDYKMVKLGKTGEAEMYSVRSDSWREIPHRAHDHAHGGLDWNYSRVIITTLVHFPVEWYEEKGFQEYHLKMGVFVAGALHWMALPAMGNVLYSLSQVKLISFDLSTEKYGELGLPPKLDRFDRHCQVEMTVLKGMLCLCEIYYWRRQSFVLWIMEDYGVVESWTKIDIDQKSCYRWLGLSPTFRPFYFDDNGEILIHVCGYYVYLKKFLGHHVEEDNNSKILVCKVDEQTLAEKDFRGCSRPICDSFVYVESLVLLEKCDEGSI